MVKRSSSGDDKSGRIFDLLKPMEKLGGNTIKDGDDGEEPQFGHCWMRPSLFKLLVGRLRGKWVGEWK